MADIMRTTGRAMALLGAGVDADSANSTAAGAHLHGEFVALMQSSAAFESFGHDLVQPLSADYRLECS